MESDPSLRHRSSNAAHDAMPSSGEHAIEDDPGCFGTSTTAAGNDHQHQHHRTSSSSSQSTTMTTRCHHNLTKLHPGSISNLCSATLGAGALSLPYAISLTGIIPGILLLLFSAYLTVISIDVIIESCRRTRLFKYEDVAVRLVGRGAGRILEASLLIFCFGTAVAYIVAVGDILDQGIRSIPQFAESNSALASSYSRERVMILFWTLVMFPLSLQRHVESLERFSSLGVFSILFLVIAAVVHSIAHGDLFGGGGDDKQQTNPDNDLSSMLWPKSFWDIVRAAPIIIFAFSCQVNVCAIYEELSPADATDSASSSDDNSSQDVLKSKQRIMARITRNGIMLCTTLYILIGLFGYLDFSHETADNILNNYCIQQSHDSLMIAASVFVAVAVVVAFPFNILPARVTLKLILERVRRRYRYGGRHHCFCGCLGGWGMLQRQSHQENSIATPEVVDDASVSSPMEEYNNDNQNIIREPLLADDRFGDRPNLVPHMSLEGMPIEEEGQEVHSMESSPLEHFLLTLFLSGSALIVALLIPGISVVFGLMGGTAASIISFILPGMFLMNGDNNTNGSGETTVHSPLSSRHQKLLPLFLVWGGTMMGVLSTGTTIYGLFASSNDAPSTSCVNGDGQS